MKLFKEYYELNVEIKSQRVGAILENTKSQSDKRRSTGQRSVYDYQVSSVDVCKEFFEFIFCMSKKKLQRLQSCIIKELDFQ